MSAEIVVLPVRGADDAPPPRDPHHEMSRARSALLRAWMRLVKDGRLSADALALEAEGTANAMRGIADLLGPPAHGDAPEPTPWLPGLAPDGDGAP